MQPQQQNALAELMKWEKMKTLNYELKIEELRFTWHIFILTLLCLREWANSISWKGAVEEIFHFKGVIQHFKTGNRNVVKSFVCKLTSKWEGERTPSNFWRSRECIISWSSRKLLKKARAGNANHGYVNVKNYKIWAPMYHYQKIQDVIKQ